MDDQGIVFLEDLLIKIKNRLSRLEDSIEAGRKDIESMHEYYWQNYTEMDQYGYEDYDNQQALLRQVSDTQEKQKLRKRWLRMMESPFFGRVDFCYDGEEEAEKFYIGIGNFAEQAGDIPLVYDWRAPVSGLFYDYDRGPASYEAPSGIISGQVTGKGQYKIRNGRMIYSFESDLKIDDEILKEELGKDGDVKLKNIVRTIQREQNTIIRNQKDRILVIQGGAGSGKTSVALHRIAYLLYHDRENLKSSDILVLTPNGIFADYISHILPELGEENIREMSFDLFAYKELRDFAADCEDRYDQLERSMKEEDRIEDVQRYLVKQSGDFLGIVEEFLTVLEDELMEFADVGWRGYHKSEEELIRLFYDRFQNIPLLSRMQAIMEYCVDEYETMSGRELTEEELDPIRQKFTGMYELTDLYQIYNQLLVNQGWPVLPDVPYEKRKLRYEDVYPMLYLKYRLYGTSAQRRIKHLVIDEMQDYSYLQFEILKKLFSCRMTILGDKMQTMDFDNQDVMSFLPKIFKNEMRAVFMDKSYRNTYEIASFAARIGGVQGLEYLDRHGKEVQTKAFGCVTEVVSAVGSALNLGENGYETAALITMTEQEAEMICDLLVHAGIDAVYINRNSERFEKGLIVTTFYLAKGLEFDQVFGVFPKEKRRIRKQAEYITATRALHELYLFYTDWIIINV